MSHLIRVATKLTDKSILCNALSRLSMPFKSVCSKVYGETVDIVLEDSHLGLAQSSDKTWMLVGDPYYTSSYKEYYGRADLLINKITSAYTAIETTSKLESLGFVCTENAEAAVNTEDGKIQMVFERGY